MFETTVTVVGRIVTPVDHRRFDNDVTRANFRVACNERRRDWNVTGGWVDGDTLYLSVTCWRGLADNLKASLQVGDPVVVRGRLYTREYEVDGRRSSVMEMEATAIGPDLARCTTVVSRAKGSGSARAAEAVAEAVAAVDAQEGALVSVGGGAEAADAP